MLKLNSTEDKKELLTRLARIEGQIRGIREMIEQEESCELVAQQLAATRAAIGKVFSELVARAIERHCLSGNLTDQTSRKKLAAMAEILAKYA
ncbi:MAG: hypothetical protein A2Z21_07660 [Candidatus Fraserbacteria bacterium RBG_16_55_9]|uniref:Transcriptional regulator n=1 Tax=Fraserbacteria sp. (strain RBG_16_55_9) TaxID=1817864 RepID=A0A1F5V2V9_FRAXR|nr:MAG: hypothetical protein A2Z21_07660 [Candidatus Fraserbacteria bacterium RBG_16_55_9]